MTLKAKMTILALLFSPFPLLYGNNDQSAIDQLSPLERRMSEPVAAMIDAETMENLEEHLPLADKIWQVFAIPGGNANGARRLCSDVKFLDELAIGTQLTTIGHPMGLPKKITRNGLVMGKIGDHYLTTTLDAVKGNSGGPVFNADTGALIGLIVNQGIQHAFSMDRKERCYRLTQYPENQTEAKNMSGVMNISLIEDVLERN